MIPACGHQFCEGCGTEALAEKGYCPDCEVPCYARELKPDPAVRYLFPAHSFLFCFFNFFFNFIFLSLSLSLLLPYASIPNC